MSIAKELWERLPTDVVSDMENDPDYNRALSELDDLDISDLERNLEKKFGIKVKFGIEVEVVFLNSENRPVKIPKKKMNKLKQKLVTRGFKTVNDISYENIVVDDLLEFTFDNFHKPGISTEDMIKDLENLEQTLNSIVQEMDIAESISLEPISQTKFAFRSCGVHLNTSLSSDQDRDLQRKIEKHLAEQILTETEPYLYEITNIKDKDIYYGAHLTTPTRLKISKNKPYGSKLLFAGPIALSGLLSPIIAYSHLVGDLTNFLHPMLVAPTFYCIDRIFSGDRHSHPSLIYRGSNVSRRLEDRLYTNINPSYPIKIHLKAVTKVLERLSENPEQGYSQQEVLGRAIAASQTTKAEQKHRKRFI